MHSINFKESLGLVDLLVYGPTMPSQCFVFKSSQVFLHSDRINFKSMGWHEERELCGVCEYQATGYTHYIYCCMICGCAMNPNCRKCTDFATGLVGKCRYTTETPNYCFRSSGEQFEVCFRCVLNEMFYNTPLDILPDQTKLDILNMVSFSNNH